MSKDTFTVILCGRTPLHYSVAKSFRAKVVQTALGASGFAPVKRLPRSDAGALTCAEFFTGAENPTAHSVLLYTTVTQYPLSVNPETLFSLPPKILYSYHTQKVQKSGQRIQDVHSLAANTADSCMFNSIFKLRTRMRARIVLPCTILASGFVRTKPAYLQLFRRPWRNLQTQLPPAFVSNPAHGCGQVLKFRGRNLKRKVRLRILRPRHPCAEHSNTVPALCGTDAAKAAGTRCFRR